jgi:hypothetical protein
LGVIPWPIFAKNLVETNCKLVAGVKNPGEKWGFFVPRLSVIWFLGLLAKQG